MTDHSVEVNFAAGKDQQHVTRLISRGVDLEAYYGGRPFVAPLPEMKKHQPPPGKFGNYLLLVVHLAL